MGCALSPKAASDTTTSVELVIVPSYEPPKGRQREKVIGGAEAMWPLLIFAVLALWFSAGPVPAAAHDDIPVVVADFDYEDTSGETEYRWWAHAARAKDVSSFLRRHSARVG